MNKLMKKVTSIVMVAALAFIIALAPTTTANAAGGITVHVEKPADWAEGMNFYAWNVDGATEPAGWPGQAMSLADGYYSFTLECETSSNVIFNDGTVQTADMIDVAVGEYWFTNGTKGDDGKYTFEQSTTNPSGAATDATPDTGDATPIIFVGIAGIAALAVAVACKKKRIA